MAQNITFLTKIYAVSYDPLAKKISVTRKTNATTFDLTFGTGGTLLLPEIVDLSAPGNLTLDIVVDSQERALISTKNTEQNFINVLRLNSNGTVDTTFGINGNIEIPTLSSALPAVLFTNDTTLSFGGTSTPIGGQTAISSTVTSVLSTTDTSPNLLLVGSIDLAIDGTGTDVNNRIEGTAGKNILDGKGGDDILNGGAGADILIGSYGNDVLFGGTDADNMNGGLGDDTYYVDHINDLVVEDTDAPARAAVAPVAASGGLSEIPGRAYVPAVLGGTDNVRSTITYTLTNNVEHLSLLGATDINGTGNGLNNTIKGNSGNNKLAGGAGIDTLYGYAGADTLDGGFGIDILAGGLGDDTYIVDGITTTVNNVTTTTVDTVIEAATEGTDTVQSSVNYTLLTNFENLILTGAAVNGTGNAAANFITGNSGNNILDGGAGADTMRGRGGNDTYKVDSLSDIVDEVYPDSSGIDTVEASINAYTLTENVEKLTLMTGATIITGVGNAAANTITGNANDNVLSGLGGNDTISGAAGNDTIFGGDGNDIISGDDGNDTLYGDAGNDILNGGAGIDILVGGVGNNTLKGGLDNDTYFVTVATDIIVEVADVIGVTGVTASGTPGTQGYVAGVTAVAAVNGGTDLVNSSVSYTLSANVENLNLLATGATVDINGTGNAGNNTINGNIGNNTLNGGKGTDTLNGAAGNDILNGGADNDILNGGDGNDILDGGLGNDTMTGGAGNDTYIVDAFSLIIAKDAVSELVNEGTNDLVKSSVDYTLGAYVEDLTLTGSANIVGTGNSDGNILTGNSGNNVLKGLGGNDFLDGGAGKDTLVGGQGNDTYTINNVNAIVVELAGTPEGDDIVNSSVNYTLTANVETLNLMGIGNINGTGNIGNNTITGNDGNNILRGGEGDDALIGGKGNDTLYGGPGTDTLTGGEGDDTYVFNTAINLASETIVESGAGGTDTIKFVGGLAATIDLSGATASGYTSDLNNLVLPVTSFSNIENATGGDGSDTITGNDAANILLGGLGNDTLSGGLGNDTLTGGAGNDNFVFKSLLLNNVDNITDFVVGADKIQLAVTVFGAFTANIPLLKSDFAIITNDDDAAGSSGKIVYNSSNGNLFYNADGAGNNTFGTNGGQFATLKADLTTLSSANFLAI